MKPRLILLAMLLTATAAGTAFSQGPPKRLITETIEHYDSMLTLVAKGIATKEALDTLQRWNKRVWDDRAELIRENNIYRYNDSVNRITEKDLTDENDSLKTELAVVEVKLDNERNKKRRPMSLSIHTGSNPFVKDAFKTLHGFGNSLYVGVGIAIDIFSFPLPKLSKGDNASAPPAYVPGRTSVLQGL